MKKSNNKNRREFVKLCGSTALAVSVNPKILAQENQTARHYHRVRLVDGDDKPITANQLEIGKSYIFSYPYVTTPCFLINLGRPAVEKTELETKQGDKYQWPGGVGPKQSIVAFSAICAHKMSHPARSVSFINYRHEKVSFTNGKESAESRSQVIFCCSENSVYDPANGGQVLGGPAPQPLAAVLLDYDNSSGALFATGTMGGEMFDPFFEKFGFRLSLENKVEDVRTPISEATEVVTIEQYSASQRLCG
ncbi:MAG: hypothetical protein OER96_09030 [Gammaproteobacteria bacterium]|nr:hypothetical protein [Gammaproteobacteria bacterium]